MTGVAGVERLTAARVFRDLLRVPDPRTRRLVPMVLHGEQRRIVEAWDAIGPDGLPEYDEYALLWIKKAAKSTTAAGLVLTELAGGMESDREIIIVASDYAQSKDVTFAMVGRFVRRHPWLSKHVTITADTIVYRETLTDGRTGGQHVEEHVVRAVPARDAKSLHGSNATLTVFDELWAQVNYETIEALARSSARLAPRVIYTSYAGLKSQARDGNPCWDLWQRWQRGDDPRLCVSYIGGPDGWRSVPWITERHVEAERRRFAAVPAKFKRLYENVWATGDAGSFLTAAEIADATDRTLTEPAAPVPGAAYSMGLDLGLTRDLSALVVTHVDPRGRVTVDAVRTWRGSKARPVNLIDVEATVRELARRFGVRTVHADSWQAALLAQRLAQQGVIVKAHTIESSKLDTYAHLLKTTFQQRQIRMPADPTLIEQLESLEGEELKKRDAVRFTAHGAAHDDLPMALCLSLEAFVKFRRASDGSTRLAMTTPIGRLQMTDISVCRVAAGGRPDVQCPLTGGASAHAGCGPCPAYQSAIGPYEAHLATGARWVPLSVFVNQHMRVCHYLRRDAFNRAIAGMCL